MKKNKLKGKKINLTAVLKELAKSNKFSPKKRANLKAAAEFLEDQQGAVYIEFAFLVAFIAIAASGAILLLKNSIAELFNMLENNVNDINTAITEILAKTPGMHSHSLTATEVNKFNHLLGE